MKLLIKKYYTVWLLLLTFTGLSVSCTDDLGVYDYTAVGEDVELTLSLNMPELVIQTQSRANIEEWQKNQVNSLWIRTYSSLDGQPTSEWLKVTTDLPSTDEEPTFHNVTLNSKSGPSYIVAVANVDNEGFSKKNHNEIKKLRFLLEDASQWSDFLDIVVLSPSTDETVNSPYTTNGLPMAGAYTTLRTHDVTDRALTDWQTENFTAYNIPSSSNGEVTLTDGAIHLRRLVSHVNFNVMPDPELLDDNNGEYPFDIKVNSFKIVNVPKFSWLYERGKSETVGDNYGDICTFDNRNDYYFTTGEFFGSSISVDGTTSSFNFWQAENKHVASVKCDNYLSRSEQVRDSNLPEGENPPANNEYLKNTGLFKHLINQDGSWSSNNMATYVLINCELTYKNQINVDDKGNTTGGTTPVYRTASTTYLVHLGYMDEALNDFNCYRNANYTYNVKVKGVNQITVEAFHGNERPDAEGLVSDITHPTYNLDCHYHWFNIQLEDEELQPTSGGRFGFILSTYRNGKEYRYEETDFDDVAGFDALSDDIKKYINWVELKPTTGEDVLALYTPRGATGSTTFNLLDASKGNFTKSDSKWYTVFVNEYSYEAANANEAVNDAETGRPLWTSYVNQNPRRFYIKVNRSVSPDGESIYARSKYAGVQRSMMTYYSLANATPNGSAIAIEHDNEVLGLNLRKSYTGTADANNGRYNCWRFTRYAYTNNNGWTTTRATHRWEYFLNQTRIQTIPAVSHGGLNVGEHQEYLPMIYPYRGTYTGGNILNEYSTQPSASTSSPNNELTIEAISACLNRNRDNNGNGVIDEDEMRWYVPAIGKYLRMIIGNRSLENPLMDYASIGSMPYGPYQRTDGTTVSGNDHCGLYMFFSSGGSDVLWAMEGMSTGAWPASNTSYNVAPWQVRCIRNLGTNLADGLSTSSHADPTTPAYIYTANGTSSRAGGIVRMTYYDNVTAVRNQIFTGNGTGTRQMPVHTINNLTYNSLYSAFEISNMTDSTTSYRLQRTINGTTYSSWYDGTLNGTGGGYTNNWAGVYSNIHSSTVNPCSKKGNGWRIPNLKELAILKNLGYFDGAYNSGRGGGTDNMKEFFVCCTMGLFDYNGDKTTATINGSSDPLKYILNATYDRITQSYALRTGTNARTNYYVRCVRDYPYNAGN